MREKQTHGRVQQRRSRAEVEQLVDAFESSGLRRREFCQKHDVAVGTLDFWRKRRRQERGEVAGHRRGARKVHARAEMGTAEAAKIVASPRGAASECPPCILLLLSLRIRARQKQVHYRAFTVHL